MSALSDYLETKLLDLTFNKVAFTGPSTYIALYTAAPGETGGGTEVTGGAYARVLVNENGGVSPTWNLATSGSGIVDNANDITFPTATASWGTVSHTSVMDASSGGNFLVYGALTANKTVGIDDIFKFNAGSYDIVFA